MKAIVCHTIGSIDDLICEEIPNPVPGPNEILVRVKAAGANFPDTLVVAGKYQERPDLPFVPGMELAGDVIETGSGVNNFHVGDRVAGCPGAGAYAEQALLQTHHATLLPNDVDYSSAAALQVVYGTSIYALKQRANLNPGETLLVTGAAGGVGLSACQIGKAMGARVIAAASNKDKLEIAAQNGADHLIDYSDGQLKEKVKELTDGKGADVIYDPVGGDIFDQCVRCINFNGRLLVIGFASGRVPQVATNLTLVKGFSVIGVYWGRARNEQPDLHQKNVATLFNWLASGTIKPYIGDRFSLENTPDALRAILARTAKGKLIVEP